MLAFSTGFFSLRRVSKKLLSTEFRKKQSSNAFFLKNPCASGVNQTLPPSDNTHSTNTSSYVVTLHSGSGNVKTAITTASNAVNAVDQFAIGVLSAENNWRTDSSSSAGYRYVKVDGVHPETGDTDRARLTAANGDYKFHMEMKQFVRADYAGKPGKTPFEAAVLTQITNALKNPDPYTTSDSSLSHKRSSTGMNFHTIKT
jgi:hypothetical protein